MERYDTLFNNMVGYHNCYNAGFKQQLDQGKVPNFAYYYYPYPQYPIDVISHILTGEGYQIFALDFYIPLTGFTNGVQKLMNSEQKLVEISEQFVQLPDKNHPNYKELRAQQMILARRFYTYLEFRKNQARNLSLQAKGIKKIIADLKQK